MFAMSGKVVLFAGGSGYLGLPACRALVAEGANVMVASRDLAHVNQAVSELGAAAAGVALDIGEPESIRAAVDATVRRFGRLDGVVNYTYGASGKPMEELTVEEFDRANRRNLTGSFVLARQAAEAMTAGGSIIMCVSMYGLVSPDPRIYEPPMPPNPLDYGVGKAGLCQMVRYLAAFYGHRGIRVNAIAPGPFPANRLQENDPAFIQRLGQRTMLRRIGRRQETAGAVLFLASDASSYVTGIVLPVDGGWTAW